MPPRLRAVLLLRCPQCLKGSLFKKPFTLHEACPHCGWASEGTERIYVFGGLFIGLPFAAALLASTAVVLAAAGLPTVYIIIAMVLEFKLVLLSVYHWAKAALLHLEYLYPDL